MYSKLHLMLVHLCKKHAPCLKGQIFQKLERKKEKCSNGPHTVNNNETMKDIHNITALEIRREESGHSLNESSASSLQ